MASMLTNFSGRDDFDTLNLDISIQNQNSPITCEVCGLSLTMGPRYRCTSCPDYDLCSKCVKNKQHNELHLFLKNIKILTRTVQCDESITYDSCWKTL